MEEKLLKKIEEKAEKKNKQNETPSNRKQDG